jgi:hypothetical protein
MLACVLGCDALFEAGHVTIDEQGNIAVPHQLAGDLEAAVRSLSGRNVTKNRRSIAYAQDHARLHARRTETP